MLVYVVIVTPPFEGDEIRLITADKDKAESELARLEVAAKEQHDRDQAKYSFKVYSDSARIDVWDVDKGELVG